MPDIGDPLLAFRAVALVALLGFAAWRDVATRTIPDGVSIALVVIGAAIRLSDGWAALAVSLLIATLLFFLLLPLCSRGLLGGADLKLLAALAVSFSPQAYLHLLVDVTMTGGALAAVYLLMRWFVAAPRLAALSCKRTGSLSRKRPERLIERIVKVEFWRIHRRAPLPYGIAIAVGTAVVVLSKQGV